MSAVDFKSELLADEVVVAHVPKGHIFHFPILANGTVSLHGSRIEPNPEAKREARRYLFEALDAAKVALVTPRGGLAAEQCSETTMNKRSGSRALASSLDANRAIWGVPGPFVRQHPFKIPTKSYA